MGVDPAQFASLDASRHSAQLRDILALRSSSLRQYLLDIVAPWSSKAQAAPAFIDGRAEL
jgi:hypothetical protein